MIKGKVPEGSITIICGSMFSGKTEELIRLVRRAMHARKKVQVFKSSLDTRCDTTVIRTHDDTRFNALAVPDSRALGRLLEPDTQIVGIEEVQFFDDAIVAMCQHLADRGVQVIAAGLDQDFRGLPFGFMPTLMALADNVLKLHAICKVCGGEASRTQRLIEGRPAAWNDPIILIGAAESYEARCRRCHRVRRVPREYQSSMRLAPLKIQEPSGQNEVIPAMGKELRQIPAKGTLREDTGDTEKNSGKRRANLDLLCCAQNDGTQLELFPDSPADV